MKELGYGEGYQYAHDTKDKVADMECLPESLRGRQYYHPTDQGSERRIREILAEIKELAQAHMCGLQLLAQIYSAFGRDR
jgi:putative ATPase